MAYVITDECVSCGTCAGECPSEAISEGADHFEINADACVDCGTCADVCRQRLFSQVNNTGHKRELRLRLQLFSFAINSYPGLNNSYVSSYFSVFSFLQMPRLLFLQAAVCGSQDQENDISLHPHS